MIISLSMMEERAVGGKEKKYVLYTVVNDDKAKAGMGVWVVRILLGTLLLVALAVVPYVSLRLAQVNDRTLVVFQPVPVHNRSRGHHHKITSHHSGNLPISHGIQSDSLVRENYTTEIPKASKKSNATLVTVHESAVTLSLLEDMKNASNDLKNQSSSGDIDQGEGAESGTVSDIFVMTFNVTPTAETDEQTEAEEEKKEVVSEKTENIKEEMMADQAQPPESEVTVKLQEVVVNPTTPSPEANKHSSTPEPTAATEIKDSKLIKLLKSTTSTTTRPPNSSETSTAKSSALPPTSSSPVRPGIVHKLAYVATASSGNHVGGICVWKTNKNVTKWSYFYENIPIEYQSYQDSTDHQMRALLAAVRLWADQWHDYHVVLRSQHQAVEGSKHLTRIELSKELERLSQGHFTYEPEWRQRKDDSLMGIAFCLAKLHKDYEYWFSEFERLVDEMLGAQDWSEAQKKNRIILREELFFTEHKPENPEKVGDLTSLSMN